MKKHLIVDIDGTIADLSHRLHHINGSSRKDWDAFFAACKYDRVHVDVVTIIKDLAARGNKPIHFITGRSNVVYQETLDWLYNEAGFLSYDFTLFMRNHGDHRTDDIVKHELYNRNLWPRGVVPKTTLAVFEDRDRVVQMWRSMGFRVLQIANGEF